MKRSKGIFLWLVLFGVSCLLLGGQVRADTIYDSPYVSFAPDGRAWTVKDEGVTHYEEGTTVNTKRKSSLRPLKEGEHYYSKKRVGEIPVGKWVAEHKYAQCIHDNYPQEEYYHGIDYGKKYCLKYYNSGWIAYCADCGEAIRHIYVYMDKEAAKTIDFLECGMGLSYYHLCPFCSNLEQGAEWREHTCKQISWNRYKVAYDANAEGGKYSGFMNDSYHMYNNAEEYEGKRVTLTTRLRRNEYKRTGYRFLGWNTRPDGSGEFYEDRAEILNLTAYDWKQDEEQGAVTLYAQWGKQESTLRIDPAGGAYNGESGFTDITQEYGTQYTVDSRLLEPPAGYRVTFVTNGGTYVEDRVGAQHFTEWSQVQPFTASIRNGVYTFEGEAGGMDLIRANYERDSIILPETERENLSFGGWYYDKEFTRPAGGVGDEIIPSENLTLYAQWVELRLYARSNYTDNNGRGAVDLWWTQSDGQNKAYRIYQSRDAAVWTEMRKAEDMGKELQVQKTFAYSGKKQSYTIPYTGLYALTAYGAQGGSCNKYVGGKGGRVSGTFWLRKGDTITCSIGGQKGYGGGGSGEAYGNGGGSTRITSQQKGLLMVAGGGGGATSVRNGGSGGSAENLRGDGKANGAAGQAGGGAGYVGGNAGQVVVHHHTAKCYKRVSRDLIKEYGAKLITDEGILREDEADEGEEDYYSHKVLGIGSAKNLIPASEGAVLKLKAAFKAYKTTIPEINGIYIYNQSGKIIDFYSEKEIQGWVKKQTAAAVWGTYQENTGFYDNHYTAKVTNHYDGDGDYTSSDVYWLSWDADGKVYKNSVTEDSVDKAAVFFAKAEQEAEKRWYSERKEDGLNDAYGSRKYIFREKVTIPKGTTGIYITLDVMSEQVWDDPIVTFDTAYLSGVKECICGYEEGQVISSQPAYGGSNYINTDFCVQYESKKGEREKNGSFTLESVDIGYLDELQLNGVPAPDLAAPEAVQMSKGSDNENPIRVEPVEGSGGMAVKVIWQEPKDRGTVYYHVAESYMASTGTRLSTSNYTKNTLVTGIKGYYYTTDNKADTQVTSDNSFTGKTQPWSYVTLSGACQYLHVAPVDGAGNIGETSHLDVSGMVVEWPPHTRALSIAGDNIYPAEAPNTWYVKADGSASFRLQFSSFIEGSAAEVYQINQSIFESQAEGEENAWNIVETPMSEVCEGSMETEGAALLFAVRGASVLREADYAGTIRSNRNKELTAARDFTLGAEAHGKRIRVTPRAAVVNSLYERYSEEGEDRGNGIFLIGDGEAPRIIGMKELPQLICRGEENLILELRAEDEHSGVKEFYVEIFNEDNTVSKRYEADASQVIRIDVTAQEPVFAGDWTITAAAADYVGNESQEVFRVTEFALETEIQRILSPHEPLFQRGESGILTIKAWGYVERVEVEFPEEFAAWNEGLNRTIVYELPSYLQTNELQFMVPLYMTEEGNYTVTVRAYKGNRHLEDYPSLAVMEVEGTILDELRTRLR